MRIAVLPVERRVPATVRVTMAAEPAACAVDDTRCTVNPVVTDDGGERGGRVHPGHLPGARRPPAGAALSPGRTWLPGGPARVARSSRRVGVVHPAATVLSPTRREMDADSSCSSNPPPSGDDLAVGGDR